MFSKKQTPQHTDSQVFIIFDSKVGTYRMPLFAYNAPELLREFERTFRNPEEQANNQYFTNAEDFSIFKIGDYTKYNGVLNIHPMEHVANLHDIRSLILRDQTSKTPQQRDVSKPIGQISEIGQNH